MKNLTPAELPIPDFTPVPRRYRYDGWTPERQRAFIAALAETGSVKAACRRINMSQEGAYYLRRQPGAESLRAAWQAALDHGVQTLTDIAIDRAIEGVSVPVFWRGEQVGEKRWYNDRLLMFILKHHLPARYGTKPLPEGTKHPDTLAREAAEAAAEAAADDEAETERLLDSILNRYAAKVRHERSMRRTGRVVAADFALRQLTHIELILDVGGRTQQLIETLTTTLAENGGDAEPWATAISAHLDALRREAWASTGEPDRPPLAFPEHVPHDAIRGGPDIAERNTARAEAEAALAAAQTKWEAAARPDSWAEWKRQHGAAG